MGLPARSAVSPRKRLHRQGRTAMRPYKTRCIRIDKGTVVLVRKEPVGRGDSREPALHALLMVNSRSLTEAGVSLSGITTDG